MFQGQFPLVEMNVSILKQDKVGQIAALGSEKLHLH